MKTGYRRLAAKQCYFSCFKNWIGCYCWWKSLTIRSKLFFPLWIVSQNQANENYLKVGIIFKHFYYEKWLWNSLKKELCCNALNFSLCRCGVFKAQYKRPTILVGNVRCFVSIRHLCDGNCVLGSWFASQTKCHIELGKNQRDSELRDKPHLITDDCGSKDGGWFW